MDNFFDPFYREFLLTHEEKRWLDKKFPINMKVVSINDLHLYPDIYEVAIIDDEGIDLFCSVEDYLYLKDVVSKLKSSCFIRIIYI